MSYLSRIVLVVFVVSFFSSNAQQVTADIYNIGSDTIILDGDASDDAWAYVQEIIIDKPYRLEQPTLNSAIWKAAWKTEGIYFLVKVSDDQWYPSWLSGLADWQSDKVEMYIDCTDPQKDGLGASSGQGNHQIAPNFSETEQGVETEFSSAGVLYASTYDGLGNYTIEYYVPFSSIPDNNGNAIDPLVNSTIGFDFTIIDCDAVQGDRNRMVWSNVGAIDESWNNMDDVGLISFVGEVTDLFARFSASMVVVAPGVDIAFTDYSTGNPTAWSWNFGDGNTSAEQNPQHAYTAVGMYTVSLTVTDSEGFHTTTKSNYIEVTEENIPPVARFTSNTASEKADVAVEFTDASLYNPTAWRWYFGDGTTSTEQNPEHIYNTSGVYTVTLKVSNVNGSNTLTKTDYITILNGDVPSVNFEANKLTIDQNTPIVFTDLSSNNPGSWFWDFGDGNTSEEQNPTHVYTVPGQYTVTLEATNNSGSNIEIKEGYINVNDVNFTSIENDACLFQVYPNPSNGTFNLNIKEFNNAQYEITIIDAKGRVIIQDIQERLSSQLNLESYAKGIYYLKIKAGNNSSITKLLLY